MYYKKMYTKKIDYFSCKKDLVLKLRDFVKPNGYHSAHSIRKCHNNLKIQF